MGNMRLVWAVLLVSTVLWSLGNCWFSGKSAQDTLGKTISSPKSEGCESHEYKTYLFSEDPLVIYIESFLNHEEASHLVSLSEEKFQPSKLFSDDGRKIAVDPSYRSSHTATLDRSEVVQCVEARAKTFPGYSSKTGLIKPLVVQRYNIANQYKDHYDWYPEGPYIDGNIESTFFVYIQANCTGGGTNFPRLKPPTEEFWCEFIDCDQPFDAGVTFKPILGNAVYWKNLDGSGVGIKDTLHAGLPVTRGTKMGMNIWTWEKIVRS